MYGKRLVSHRAFFAGTLSAGIAFSVIWSLSFIVAKGALQSISPLWLSGLRLTLAGVVLLLVNGAAILSFWRNVAPRTVLRVLISGFLCQAVYLGTCFWALVHLPTSIVNIVVSTLPLMSLPFSFFLLGEKIGLAGIAAFVLSIAGVVIALISGIDETMRNLSLYGFSALVVFGSVVALALGNTLIKPVISEAALLPFCAFQFTSSGVVSIAIALAHDGVHMLSFGVLLQEAFSLFFLAFIGSILGTVLWFRVLRAMPANTANTFFLLTPIFGIIFGYLIFEEQITWSKVLGVLVICSAIGLRLNSIPSFSGLSNQYGIKR